MKRLSWWREGRKEITTRDLEEAATKVKLGPQKKRTQSDEDKKMTAYHEVGHAITNWAQRAWIRCIGFLLYRGGMSLGHTLVPPAR